jgi:spore coat protein H
MVGWRIYFTMVAGLTGSVLGCDGNVASSASERVAASKRMAASERVVVSERVAATREDESERVFDTSVLHEIRIEIEPEYLEELEENRKQRVPCTFIFDGRRLENVAIRLKGRGSQDGTLEDKPSFSIRFDELETGQRLYGLDKLILNNAKMDPTLLDEHLGYYLYQRAGIPSRRSAHAVVTLSGMPSGDLTYGIHVMVEAVNDTLMARHFGEPHDHGNLFEDEDAGDFAADPYGLDLKDEDEPGRSYERLVEFADFLNTASDDELVERLDEFIDLDKALDSFALDLLLDHVDGFWLAAHNYYLYEHPADRRFILLPHGMDLLFEPDGRVCGTVPEPENLPTTLGEWISDQPELRARVEQSIDRLLDEVWDVELIHERIDALTMLLEDSDHDEPAFVEQREAHLESREALERLVSDVEEVWRGGAATCGDGVRTGNELCPGMCDDGNLDDDDGCSSECLVEVED